MVVLLRVLIGAIFFASGAGKILSPYQNFLYVIQGYDFLPEWAAQGAAVFFPWLELFTGLFLMLGLWCEASLKSALIMFAAFITVVGQALIRRLPLDNCGCFGELIHFPLQAIIVFDSAFFLLSFWLLRNCVRVKALSLDRYFDK